MGEEVEYRQEVLDYIEHKIKTDPLPPEVKRFSSGKELLSNADILENILRKTPTGIGFYRAAEELYDKKKADGEIL